MRKLAFLIGFLLSFTIQAQVMILGVVGSSGGSTPPAGVDSASWESGYKAVYYSWASRPALDTADHQNTLYKKINSFCNPDLMYVTAVGRIANSYTNWVSPGTNNITETGAGSLTFTAYEGWKGDGTNYFTTGYNPSVDGVNYTQNSASLWIYYRINQNVYDAGLGNTGSPGGYCTGQYSDIVYFMVNQSSSNSVNPPGTDGSGFWGASRTGAAAVSAYRNGLSISDVTTASVGVPNVTFYVLHNGFGQKSTNQFSFALVADGISAALSDSINVAIEAYMDFLGKGVEP